MTAAELTAVCARHGIILEHDEDGHHAHLAVASGPRLLTEFCESAADAVCALLKDRWEMVTWMFGSFYWQAKSLRNGMMKLGHKSELAVVVALADRLAVTP